MKSLQKLLVFVVGVAGLISCTSTKTIQKNINASSYSLAYLMDSKISDVKTDIQLAVDTVYFNTSSLADTTVVNKEKGWFLPLVFVYVWNSQNNCVQGKSMIEEDIPSFAKKSMIDEINRSGNFNSGPLHSADYTIELSIDQIEAKGPYVSNGFFYFALYAYGYSYSDRAGPAISNLTVSYKLKKDGQVVHRNSFQSEKMTEQINKRYNNPAMLQQDYAISMVEATSYNFKNVIESIVRDLNTYFSKPLTQDMRF